jgi:hypothetical protein
MTRTWKGPTMHTNSSFSPFYCHCRQGRPNLRFAVGTYSSGAMELSGLCSRLKPQGGTIPKLGFRV